MKSNLTKQAFIPEELDNYRLDKALAILFSEFSRANLQQWIRNGNVKVNGVITLSNNFKVRTQQEIMISAQLEPRENWSAQSISLNIIYEDQDLIVINKPAGLVVHPGAGNLDHTLVNALLHYEPELAHLPRAGLIHRLDKQTSGLLVIARNLMSHCYLVKALQAHDIIRVYEAVVYGVLISGATINADIGRHPQQRTKMAVKLHGGKSAITHYRILNRFSQFTHIRVQLETGRTHQIRVHLTHIHHPLVGDPLYGKRNLSPQNATDLTQKAIQNFNRQALHASSLTLKHPTTGLEMTWQAPLPLDMQELLDILVSEK